MNQLPAGLETFMLTATFGLSAVVLAVLALVLKRVDWPTQARVRTWLAVAVVLLGWQLVVLWLARTGFFVASPDQYGAGILVAIVLPTVLGFSLFAVPGRLSRVIEATPLAWLVGIQFYRVVGAVFLVLWAGGYISGVFAIPAGGGDLLIWIAAVVVGVMLTRAAVTPRAAAVWNTLGIADLIVAVTMGFLSAPGHLQLLAMDHPNEMITAYPLVLVPLFGVPLSLILHSAVAWKLRRAALPGVVASSVS